MSFFPECILCPAHKNTLQPKLEPLALSIPIFVTKVLARADNHFAVFKYLCDIAMTNYYPTRRWKMRTFPIVGRLADQRDQRTEGPEGGSRSTIAMNKTPRMTMSIRWNATRRMATTLPATATKCVPGLPFNGMVMDNPAIWYRRPLPSHQAPWAMAGTLVQLCGLSCAVRSMLPWRGTRHRRYTCRTRREGPQRSAAGSTCRCCKPARDGLDPGGRCQSWTMPTQPDGRRVGPRSRSSCCGHSSQRHRGRSDRLPRQRCPLSTTRVPGGRRARGAASILRLQQAGGGLCGRWGPVRLRHSFIRTSTRP
jgi:hypothetical protein